MSNYSEYIKSRKRKDMEFFFGEDIKMLSNKYFEFKRVFDEDNIIVVTNNIIQVKGNFCLVVGNNKAVYLKDWQVKELHNFYEGIQKTYAVKLNRNFFKPYTFKKDFEQFDIDEDMDFDSFMEIAKEQQERNLKFALGKSKG